MKSGKKFSPMKMSYNFDQSDPYQPTIVENLLQGMTEWQGVDDIVRLTFLALRDVVKA